MSSSGGGTRTAGDSSVGLEQFYRQQLSPGAFDLSSSSPPPWTARECFAAAGLKPDLNDIPLAYEVGGGSHELRASVARLYEDVRPEQVLITAGALEAIRVAAGALIGPGDRIAVQTPAYGALRQAVLTAGGVPFDWRPAPSSFQFDALDLLPGSLALVNTPHGPSGSLLRGGSSYSGRFIADEVYRPIELVPGAVSSSTLAVNRDSIVIGDLSKPLGLGGLRIGWLVCRDASVVAAAAQALDYLSGSVSTLSARVAQAALACFADLLRQRLEPARRNLSHLSSFIETYEDYLDWTPPQAGYTAFVRFRGGPPDDELFAALKARGVFLLPGSVFDCPDHVRIGFGAEEAAFRNALARLGEVLPGFCQRMDAEQSLGDVILFTKAPKPGVAKTRLAAEIGESTAARLAASFLLDTVAICRAEARQLFVSFTPDDAGNELSGVAPGATFFTQQGEGQGNRLASAFKRAFSGGARSPVLVGSDSPTLPGNLIRAAHAALVQHDLVVGPAEDGGFYCLGMNQPHRALFDGIDWSTSLVLDELRENALRLGLSIFWLPYWYDVDTAADLPRLAVDPLLGPATARVLTGLYGS